MFLELTKGQDPPLQSRVRYMDRGVCVLRMRLVCNLLVIRWCLLALVLWCLAIDMLNDDMLQNETKIFLLADRNSLHGVLSVNFR